MNPAEEKMGPEALPTAEPPEPEDAKDMERLLAKPLNLDLSNPIAALLDPVLFNQIKEAATIYAHSLFVPDHFRNNLPNCFIAIQLAIRWGVDPFQVMQNLYIIHGKPGIQAVLVIALVNTRGPFTGPIQWEYGGKGNDRYCRAYAVHKRTGEECSAMLTWATVVAEGWASKSGSKWKTMEEQMFAYRSATFLTRRYCPEVLMGMKTVDEVQDILANEVAPPPATTDPTARTSALAAKIAPNGPSNAVTLETPEDAPQATKPPEATQGAFDGVSEKLDAVEPPSAYQEVMEWATELGNINDTDEINDRLLALASKTHAGKRGQRRNVHMGNLKAQDAAYLSGLMDCISEMGEPTEGKGGNLF